jgi:hypothetical protein
MARKAAERVDIGASMPELEALQIRLQALEARLRARKNGGRPSLHVLEGGRKEDDKQADEA